MKKWKIILINGLGAITTVATIAIIYFVLYLQGIIRHIDQATVIEFLVLIILSGSTKFFWYSSTESSIRNSKSYTDKKESALAAIKEIVVDQQDFDKFIDNENDKNYNRYVSNHCKNLTIRNFRPTIWNKLENLYRKFKKLPPKTNVEFLNDYVHHIERKANGLHKLSASNILSLSVSEEGLTDDRNMASSAKMRYLIGGSILSIVTTFATAMISFQTNADVDTKAAAVKMVMYSANILMSILQTIIKALLTVSSSDTEYFRKIVNILEKYEDYKVNPEKVVRVEYEIKEVENAITDEPVAPELDKPVYDTGRAIKEYKR